LRMRYQSLVATKFSEGFRSSSLSFYFTLLTFYQPPMSLFFSVVERFGTIATGLINAYSRLFLYPCLVRPIGSKSFGSLSL
jgi:hypothetical protein